MADYIPQGDAEFHTWQAAFVTYANANLIGLGLVAGDMTPITAAQTAWGSAYTADVDGAEAGKTAQFMGVWVNRKGERGPLSATVSATVPG